MLSYSKSWFLLIIIILTCMNTNASSLSNIRISNNVNWACITFNFIGNPIYKLSKISKSSIALDIKNPGVIQILPIHFNGKNIVKSIRFTSLRNIQSIRLIINLSKNNGKFHVKKQKNGSNYTVVFFINSNIISPFLNAATKQFITFRSKTSTVKIHSIRPNDHGFFKNHSERWMNINNLTRSELHVLTTSDRNKIIIAIDAGHGGQDPGAIGSMGTQEKNITISIAKKLQTLLNSDSVFKGVMIRNGDYFISVTERSDMARRKNANFLVSIHTDANLNHNVTGASVWILSNCRANSEVENLLEKYKKKSQLMGDANNLLLRDKSDPYFSQAVLDLQFGYSQRVGYDVAIMVLNQLKNISSLHKHYPERASFGVLRSPDIPSILVETGFISNNKEEHLLATTNYQQQIAEAIYRGLRHYFKTYPLKWKQEIKKIKF